MVKMLLWQVCGPLLVFATIATNLGVVEGVNDAEHTLTVAVLSYKFGDMSFVTDINNATVQYALENLKRDGLRLQNINFRFLFAAPLPFLKCTYNSYRSLPYTIPFAIQEKASAFLGPVCSPDNMVLSVLASDWNIPTIAYYAVLSKDLSDRKKYPTFARVVYQLGLIGETMAKFMLEFAYKNVVVIVPTVSNAGPVTLSKAVLSGIKDVGLNMTLLMGEADDPLLAEQIKTQLIGKTRVVMLIVLHMANAIPYLHLFERLGIRAPDYVRIAVRSISAHESEPWNGNGSERQLIKQLFNDYFILDGLRMDDTSGEAFLEKLKPYMKGPIPQTEIMYSVMLMPLYDAMYIYGRALYEVMNNGKNGQPGYSQIRNGTMIWGQMPRMEFNDSTGFTVTLDDVAERLLTHVINHYSAEADHSTEAFRLSKVLKDSSCKDDCYHLVWSSTPPASYWPYNNGSLPPELDDCKLYGVCIAPIDAPLSTTTQAVPDNEDMSVYYLLVGMGLLLCIAAYMFYSQKKRAQELENLWRVPRQDLVFADIANARKESLVSVSSTANKDEQAGPADLRTNSRLSTKSQTTRTLPSGSFAVVRGTVATYTKYVQRRPLNFSKEQTTALNELKKIQHDSINAFLGVCFNEENEMLVLWKYTTRGTLKDVVYNKDLNLEMDFRSSFIRDIVRGLEYLHNQSPIGCHGRLNMETCLVESHWLVKLSGFGLANIIRDMILEEELELPEEERQLNAESAHVAPELLRYRTRDEGILSGTTTGDVYSLGMIFYQIMYRIPPYQEDFIPLKDVLEQIENPKGIIIRPPFPPQPTYHPDLMTMVKHCWTEDPLIRPRIKHIKHVVGFTLVSYADNVVDHMMKMMNQYAGNLEKLVKDRTSMLEEAQERADALLAQMLPPSIVDDLKTGKAVPPKMYQSVTVLFTDIVSFTTLCSDSTPIQIVTFLNEIYSEFDAHISKRDAYKVETIGDAYMVVSGLPKTNGKKHVKEIASLSLGMLKCVTNFKLPHIPGQGVKLRLGFHSGPCAAGVVGMTAPRYCLFGDTVNMASRMESTSEAMKIQLSDTSKLLLQNNAIDFRTIERGFIDVKGKGRCLTHWLLPQVDYTTQL